LSYAARIVVAAVALYLIFRGEDIGHLSSVLLGISPAVFAAAFALYLASQFLIALRWFTLLKVQSIDVSLWAAIKLYAMALFYNNLLPTAMGGDFVKAWYVTRHTHKKLEAVLSIFVDRTIGLAGIFIMAISAYLIIPVDISEPAIDQNNNTSNILVNIAQYRAFFLAAAVIVIITVILLVATTGGRYLIRRLWVFIRQQSKGFRGRIKTSMLLYYSHKPTLALAMLLSLLCQVLFVFSLWVIAIQAGLQIPIRYFFVFFPLSWFFGALPISIGGLGIMEGWIKVMFERVAGADSAAALVLAVCQRLLLLLGSVPGAVIHLSGAHLPEDIFIDYDESVN